jgi:mono/diheme cytochrome c family protein
MKKLANCASAVAAAMTLWVAVSSAQAPAGDAKKGKQLYMDYSCYACHGFSGQNGPGARLVPMKMAAVAFTAYVRNPRTKGMPSYSAKVLTDGQLGDIWSYVRTLPDSKSAKEIPLLQEIAKEVK